MATISTQTHKTANHVCFDSRFDCYVIVLVDRLFLFLFSRLVCFCLLSVFVYCCDCCFDWCLVCVCFDCRFDCCLIVFVVWYVVVVFSLAFGVYCAWFVFARMILCFVGVSCLFVLVAVWSLSGLRVLVAYSTWLALTDLAKLAQLT